MQDVVGEEDMQVGIVPVIQEEEVGIESSQSATSLCMVSGLCSRSTGIINHSSF
jgi:hypothetical protein